MPSLTLLDPSSEAAIIKAYVACVPLRDIAFSFHVGHTRLMRLLKAEGVYHAQVPTFDAANVVSQERRTDRDARILALWEQGVPVEDISAQMDLTRDLVKNVLRRAGYTFPYAHGKKVKVPRCRCCEILLSETDGRVCSDCLNRYMWDGATWQRRAGYVMNLRPLPQMVDSIAGWAPGWGAMEVEE